MSGLWTVLGRELRFQARGKLLIGLRVSAAALLLGLLLETHRHQPLARASDGIKSFARLTTALIIGTLAVAPVLAADSLSREKREGTLGLLLLTPLSALEIVVAKAAVHLLRAGSFLFAAVPVLMIPLLLGGVSPGEIALAVCHIFSVLWLALGAGMLASALATKWVRAVLLAQALAAIFALGFAALLCIGFSARVSPFLPGLGDEGMTWREFISAMGLLATNYGGFWNDLFNFLPLPGQRAWVALGWQSVIFFFGFFLLLLLVASHRLALWRDHPPGGAGTNPWAALLTRPLLVASREGNRPNQRARLAITGEGHWSSRLAILGWCLVTLAFFGLFVAVGGVSTVDALRQALRLFALFLLGAMAFSAANSFRRERNTGWLELLLVTPVSEGKILGRRLGWIWLQFAVSAITLLLLCFYGLPEEPALWQRPGYRWVMAASFITTPLVGIFFALRCRHFVSAWVATLAVAIIAPYFACALLVERYRVMLPADMRAAILEICAVQLLCGAVGGWAAHRLLARRRFALTPIG